MGGARQPEGIKGTYVKTRLVPFGEYIPFRQQLGWLTKISKASPSNMAPGGGAQLLDAADSSGAPLPIGVLICFESAFPDMSRVDADLGAQSSSTSRPPRRSRAPGDPTSTRTSPPSGPRKPGGRRAGRANRGHGGLDARGRQLAWLDQSGSGVVTVTVSLPSGAAKTFYDQAGDYVMWSGVAITLLAALVMLVAGDIF